MASKSKASTPKQTKSRSSKSKTPKPRKPRTPTQQEKRKKALEALSEGYSYRKAAKFAGVSDTTIRDWLTEADFLREYEENLEKTRIQAERRLKGSSYRIADKLLQISLGKSKATSQQVAACRDLLNRLRVGQGPRVEVSGQLSVSKMSDEELEALIHEVLP